MYLFKEKTKEFFSPMKSKWFWVFNLVLAAVLAIAQCTLYKG